MGDIGSPNSHFPHVLGEQSKRGDDFFFLVLLEGGGTSTHKARGNRLPSEIFYFYFFDLILIFFSVGPKLIS